MTRIVKLNPFISKRVWGGDFLKKVKNLDIDGPVGETWEVSTLEEGSSYIGDKPLREVCDINYLVKFINTTKNLSIQVHPDKEYCEKNNASFTKNECWIVLNSEPGAGIYLGLKSGITKKEFFNAAENSLALDKFLNFYPVNLGDFIFVPAGSIHAIGGGVTLVEIQNKSGVTFRVWDWNRLGLDGKPRELHIEEAKEVVNFNFEFNSNLKKYFKKNLFKTSGVSTLFQNFGIHIQLFNLEAGKKIELNLKEKDSIIILKGKIKGDIELDKFTSSLTISRGLYQIESLLDTSFLVVSE